MNLINRRCVEGLFLQLRCFKKYAHQRPDFGKSVINISCWNYFKLLFDKDKIFLRKNYIILSNIELKSFIFLKNTELHQIKHMGHVNFFEKFMG